SRCSNSHSARAIAVSEQLAVQRAGARFSSVTPALWGRPLILPAAGHQALQNHRRETHLVRLDLRSRPRSSRLLQSVQGDSTFRGSGWFFLGGGPTPVMVHPQGPPSSRVAS